MLSPNTEHQSSRFHSKDCREYNLIGALLDYVSALLYSLHWLSVNSRIRHRFLVFTFQALRGQGPSSPSALASPYRPSHSLCSSNSMFLTHSRFVCCCSLSHLYPFSLAALYGWTHPGIHLLSAPSLHMFKSFWKTYFFSQASGSG